MLHARLASALFEIETNEPSRPSRKVLWSVCGLIGVLIVWACIARLDIVAVASGRLVPKTYVKIVQPAEGGVIREILVEEGEAVEQGEVLARLDPTVNTVDHRALERLELRRIEAELAGAALAREPGDDPALFAQVEAQLASGRQSYEDSVAQARAARSRALRELDASRELLEKLEATLPSYEQAAQETDWRHLSCFSISESASSMSLALTVPSSYAFRRRSASVSQSSSTSSSFPGSRLSISRASER